MLKVGDIVHFNDYDGYPHYGFVVEMRDKSYKYPCTVKSFVDNYLYVNKTSEVKKVS